MLGVVVGGWGGWGGGRGGSWGGGCTTLGHPAAWGYLACRVTSPPHAHRPARHPPHPRPLCALFGGAARGCGTRDKSGHAGQQGPAALFARAAHAVRLVRSLCRAGREGGDGVVRVHMFAAVRLFPEAGLSFWKLLGVHQWSDEATLGPGTGTVLAVLNQRGNENLKLAPISQC